MNANTPARHRGFAALFTILTGLFIAMPAAAQQSAPTAEDDDSGIAVLTADKVYIRSGAANSYYPFGMLREGALVKVLEEKYNWARIATVGPAFEDLFGYIKQTRNDNQLLRLNTDATQGVTLGRVNVVAANLETGNSPQHSWKPIAHLDPDETVAVLRVIESDSQTIYAVALPKQASGWVSMAHLRDADDEELRKWKQQIESPTTTAEKATATAAKPAKQPAPTPLQMTPADESSIQDTILAREESAETPTVTAPPQKLPTDDRVLAPVQSPEGNIVSSNERNDAAESLEESYVLEESTRTPAPERSQQTSPTREQETSWDENTNDLRESAAAPINEAPTKTAPPHTPAERLNALEAAFLRLREEPIETAEVGLLQDLFAELSEDPKAEQQVEMYARSRAEQLRIWGDLQTRKRELKQLRSKIDIATEDVQAVQYSLQTSGSYTAVGRIAASTVYDGTQLPRLYRIQDPATGRTIAYMRPQEKLDLTGMLGQLIGVVGDKEYDGSLRLNIIDPQRIDLLAPQPERVNSTNAAAGG